MKAPTTLMERWFKPLDERLRTKNQHRKTAELENLLNHLIIDVATLATRSPEISKRLTEDLLLIKSDDHPGRQQAVKRVIGFREESGTVFDNILTSFSRAAKDQDYLFDLRRQEDWAAFWDHVRTLMFRTFTTVMIAATVLGTGYISMEYKIPLPLLRGI